MSPLHPEKETMTLESTEFDDLITRLPEKYRQPFQKVLDRVQEENNRHQRVLRFIQDALTQIRLDMKYLMFDLDATRRERDDYKQQLDNMQQ
ncbi:MAG: transcriptional regulator [Thermoguttaceae bacterium]|nr:transcriptional regulator [Thermoguttaceae bacterium]